MWLLRPSNFPMGMQKGKVFVGSLAMNQRSMDGKDNSPAADRPRYTDDTHCIQSLVFFTGPCRTLRCDRCLAITT
jgi:hypothetical protein